MKIHTHTHIYIYVFILLWIGRRIQSNNKAMVKATLLEQIDSKIKTGEGSSSITILLTCINLLTGKVQEKIL